MARPSHIAEFNTRQLMAFIFLIERALDENELKEAINDPKFIELWHEAERHFESLIQYYPDEDEEKYYLVATLDAVHNIDPYSEEALNLKIQYKPFIEILSKR